MMSADELSALADCMAIILDDIRRQKRDNAPSDDTGCDDNTQLRTADDKQ